MLDWDIKMKPSLFPPQIKLSDVRRIKCKDNKQEQVTGIIHKGILKIQIGARQIRNVKKTHKRTPELQRQKIKVW